ncbi:MAG TPA: hypothetical protein VK669_01900 [Candidatus Limnocylindrales bacterium]|nr:hypothetical protein [Candidatus Limnocylindrales bacterium]
MPDGRIAAKPLTRIALERRDHRAWAFVSLVPDAAEEEEFTLSTLFGAKVGFRWFSVYPALPVEYGLPSDVAPETRIALAFDRHGGVDYCHLRFAEFQRFDLSHEVRHTILIPVSDAHEYVRTGSVPGWSVPSPTDTMLQDSVTLDEALENPGLGGRRCRIENVTTYRSELSRWLAGLDQLVAQHGDADDLRMIVRRERLRAGAEGSGGA